MSTPTDVTRLVRSGWSWRIAHPVSAIGSDRFHAYDASDHMACDPGCGLMATVREPHEGDDLCPACMTIVAKGLAS